MIITLLLLQLLLVWSIFLMDIRQSCYSYVLIPLPSNCFPRGMGFVVFLQRKGQTIEQQMKKRNPRHFNSKFVIEKAYTAPMWLLGLLAY